MAKITDSCDNHEQMRKETFFPGFAKHCFRAPIAMQPGVVADVLLNTTQVLPTTREVADKVILCESLPLPVLHT